MSCVILIYVSLSGTRPLSRRLVINIVLNASCINNSDYVILNDGSPIRISMKHNVLRSKLGRSFSDHVRTPHHKYKKIADRGGDGVVTNAKI